MLGFSLCTAFYFMYVFNDDQTGSEAFQRRYKIDVESDCGKMYVLIISSYYELFSLEVWMMF
jgi:hypothetical protein